MRSPAIPKKNQKRRQKKGRPPPGSPPGSLYPGEDASPSRIGFIGYNSQKIVETQIPDLKALDDFFASNSINWIDVQGLGNTSLLQDIGLRFGVHPLVLSDIVHVNQRPKVEVYENHVFVVLRIPRSGRNFASEQICLYIGDSFLISFQEREGDCFDPVRLRLRKEQGRIRTQGVDYLLYALIDAAVDSYFPIIESYGETLDTLEDHLLSGQQTFDVRRVHEKKRELLQIRRIIWPLREMISMLTREDVPLISPTTRIFLRDCYDHSVQLMDMIEYQREMASSLLDIYLSTLSTKMNDVMKTLTIIATIFIPLTFVAGVYGMNFDPSTSPWNMPELGWKYGYPAVLLGMAVIALGLVWYFRRKGWIGRQRLFNAHDEEDNRSQSDKD